MPEFLVNLYRRIRDSYFAHPLRWSIALGALFTLGAVIVNLPAEIQFAKAVLGLNYHFAIVVQPNNCASATMRT